MFEEGEVMQATWGPAFLLVHTAHLGSLQKQVLAGVWQNREDESLALEVSARNLNTAKANIALMQRL